MKQLNQFINEYIINKKLDKPIDSEDHYEYFPKTKQELRKNIQELLDKNIHDFNCIDTSAITDMSGLFYKDIFFTIAFNVSNWNVSNVKSMRNMFKGCENFDCDLSKWDVSNVEDMSNMFYRCYKFTGKGLENWNVSNVKYIARMFTNCLHFDCDFSNWNIHNVRSTFGLFWNCGNFKGKGLENWDVGNVINMDSMFAFCTKFNCNLSKWNVSTNTTDMGAMFRNCYNFDCDLSNWDVSNVKHMDEMFVNCSKFKGKGLENWNVSNIEPTNMSDMFKNCKSLKRPSWYKGNI